MSNRLRGFLLVGLGLAALIVLALVLVAVFGTPGGGPVAQGPYPLGTLQPTPRSIASPQAPTPRATATPDAYPLRLPTASGPERTPWPTFTPWPTPVPPPPPKPVGLRIVWVELAAGETLGNGQTFTFYMADVGDIGNRKVLYTTPRCRDVQAALSPDGSTIAFTTYQSSHPESDGTLWIMRLDEGQPRELTRGMAAGYQLWSKDNRRLVYIRYTPRVSPPTDKESALDRPEIHIISVDGKEDKTLIAEDDVEPGPLGWTADGRLLYTFSGARPDIQRGLWSLDVASGERTFVMALPANRRPELAPDGRRLLLWTEEGVTWFSADGRQRQRVDFPGVVTVKPTPTTPVLWETSPTPRIARVYWTATSAEVIFQTGPTTWRIGNLDTGAVRDITVALGSPGLIDDLLSVSPDNQWLLVSEYASGGIRLLPANSHYRITVLDKGVFFRFAGWLPHPSDNRGTP